MEPDIEQQSPAISNTDHENPVSPSCLENKFSDKKKASSSSEEMMYIYIQARHKTDMEDYGIESDTPVPICFWLVLWLILNRFVPRLRKLTLLGSPLWKWSLLAVIITCGYIVTYAVCSALIFPSLAFFFEKIARLRKREYKLGFINAFWSMTFVVHFGIILVLCLSYFGTEHGLKNASAPHPEAFEYVTWTCVSLFVGSILWLVKTLLLSNWRANAIYHRFQARILITWVKFMYLGIIIGLFFEDRTIISKLEELKDARHTEKTRLSFTNHIMSRKLDTTSLESIGRSLMELATIVRSQEEDGIPCVTEIFQDKIADTDEKCKVEDLFNLLSCCDTLYPDPPEDYQKQLANVLYTIVREQCGSDEFTFDDLKKWMVDAHKNCVNMGRTLADSSAIATRLDIFISFMIFIAVVLLWLLITGVATTQVLVTIATPILALTFIFGDSAKAFFQGIIFCFATQALNVGDRCILDDTELEVESTSILTTIFNKIGTAEKRMYPNSVLATKAIANLGWKPDPTDVVELTLDSSTTPAKLQMLEDKIRQYFNHPDQKGSFDKKHEVMMKEIGDKMKVAIHFTHVLNIKDMAHGQCLHKKYKQRSVFLKNVNRFLDHNSPTEAERDPSGGLVNNQVSPGPTPVIPLTRARSWS